VSTPLVRCRTRCERYWSRTVSGLSKMPRLIIPDSSDRSGKLFRDMTAQELRDEWQVNVTDTLTELLLKVIRFAFGLIHARLRRLEQDNPPP
jgi:hypothetical protein